MTVIDPSFFGSVQESDRARDFGGVGFPVKAGTGAVVAVEMWEPTVGAGFQAPWDGQKIFRKDSAIGPTERHFHSEPAILPILVQMSSVGAAQDQNPCFQKAA
jgi:hypothetical protein